MLVPLLITRAADDWEETIRRLPGGYAAIAAPVVEYRPAGEPADLAACAAARPSLAVSTPRSVPVALLLAPGREVWALAPRTASELAAAGVSVHAVEGGAVELIDAVRPDQTLLLTSDLGAKRAKQAWPMLAVLVTHHTCCPARLPDAALAILAGSAAFDVLLASPSAADNLETLAAGALRAARRVLCHGASTLHAARRHGAAAEPFSLGA